MASKRLQYKKALSRAKREIKKAERLGYVIDEELDLSLPKRVTKKNLEEIKRVARSGSYKKQSHNRRTAKPKEPPKTKAIINVEHKTGRKHGSRSLQLEKIKRTRVKKKRIPENYKPFTKPITKQQKKSFEEQAKSDETVSPTSVDIIDLYYRYIQEYQEKLSPPIGTYSGYKWDLYELANDSLTPLLSIFEDKVNEMDNNGLLQQYSNYLQDRAPEFAEALKVIIYASNLETIQVKYIEAVGIINQGALTFSQAVDLENNYGFINE